MLSTWFTTQILPSLISVTAGATFGAVVAGWDKLAAKYMLAKLGPSIKTVYNIIDPILDASLKGWNGSDVEAAIGLAIDIVADGKLGPDEVNKAAKLIAQRWLPQVAAQKVADGVIGQKELLIAEKIREAVETKSLDAPDFLKTVKEIYIK